MKSVALNFHLQGNDPSRPLHVLFCPLHVLFCHLHESGDPEFNEVDSRNVSIGKTENIGGIKAIYE